MRKSVARSWFWAAWAVAISWPLYSSCDRRDPASGAASESALIDGQRAGVIVVLGSSTAAGTGPSRPENAWVERYRAYLSQAFPKFQLINLAVGGYTTYEIQPADYAPPANRPRPDANHDITKALAEKPNAIIINLPSNDQASSFSLAEQLANYDRVVELGARRGVSFWVTTSQPRNFEGAAQRQELVLARDAIRQKFGDHTLDFWTPFAEKDGTLKASFDSGDGTHMNDAAHALLLRQLIQAKIPEAILRARP